MKLYLNGVECEKRGNSNFHSPFFSCGRLRNLHHNTCLSIILYPFGESPVSIKKILRPSGLSKHALLIPPVRVTSNKQEKSSPQSHMYQVKGRCRGTLKYKGSWVMLMQYFNWLSMKISRTVLFNTVATGHMWVLSTWNVAAPNWGMLWV